MGSIMKITKLEIIRVKDNKIFLKIFTDEGIVGYGEPVLETYANTTAQAVREFEKYLLGKDPKRIMHHWQAMYRGVYRGGPIITSAISGIEQAMWDILGKYLGVPVYQLLGGACRDKIKMYTQIHGDSPKEHADDALNKIAQGYKALKMTLPLPLSIIENKEYVDNCVAIIAEVRKVVGSSIDIAVDFHTRVNQGMAKILIKEIEPFNPFFIEEPCPPENVDVLMDIARSTHIPIATGERLFAKWAFREILEKRAAFILQPDVSHAGGIMELRNIAVMAETYYSCLAPHCPSHGPIALASSFQVDAAIPNFLIQETVGLGGAEYLLEPFKIEDGYVNIPKKPGLGIELNEDYIDNNRRDYDLKLPLAYNSDGSITEW